MASPDLDKDPADAPAFPQDPAEFDSDPRISFSMLDNKFILETEDGQEFEYDTGIKRWVQKVCPAQFLLPQAGWFCRNAVISIGPCILQILIFRCTLGR